jgi:hypothetical protein
MFLGLLTRRQSLSRPLAPALAAIACARNEEEEAQTRRLRARARAIALENLEQALMRMQAESANSNFRDAYDESRLMLDWADTIFAELSPSSSSEDE